jgi:hypothetical protein
MSTQESTIKNDELDLSLLAEKYSNQSVLLPPGWYCYFYVGEGQNYNVVASNQDDSFDLTIIVNDHSGSGWKRVIIEPGRQASVNGTRGKILALNNTPARALDRPSAFVSIYPA